MSVLTIFLVLLMAALMTVSGRLYTIEEVPNFAVGLGYGLFNEQSLMNINFKVMIPVNKYLSIQVLLNNNYLINGSARSDFAQSKFSSNWFARNEHGCLGVSEIEPMDENLDSERESIVQLMGEMFLDAFTLTINYISNESILSNITNSRVGVSYYNR